MANQNQRSDDLLAMVVPTGTIVPFAGKEVPPNWLLCDGRAVKRKDYPYLYQVIGTKYGSGDGSTTFNLPNMDGRFAEGTTTETDVGHVEEAGVPNLKGSFVTEFGNEATNNSGKFIYGMTRIGQGDSTGGGAGNYSVNYDASRVSSVYSDTATTLSIPSITMFFIIKYLDV